MIISLILAMSQNRVIGKNNKMPWSLPKDIKRFKDITFGHPIILGRKNYESMKHALPDRTSLVISRKQQYKLPDAKTFQSVENAIQYAKRNPQLQKHHLKEQEIFIIGGGQIYDYTLKKDLVDRVYITILEKKVKGDIFFVDFDFSSWNLTYESDILYSNNISYKDFIYQKINYAKTQK